MNYGTIVIFPSDLFTGRVKAGDEVTAGEVHLGFVDRVEGERVYVRWDSDVQIGSYQPRRSET